MKMNFLPIALWTLLACSKSHSVTPVKPPPPDTTVTTTPTLPAQYGTPFAGVPDPRDVTIYQVNMRAFSATHNLQGVINRLDSIKALGVNVIYLMPVYPVGVYKSVNSPYCIRSLDSVGTEFGSRHQQYEKFYGGASFIVKTNVYRNFDWKRAGALVDAALALPPTDSGGEG